MAYTCGDCSRFRDSGYCAYHDKDVSSGQSGCFNWNPDSESEDDYEDIEDVEDE